MVDKCLIKLSDQFPEHRAGFHVDLGLKPYGSYNASKWRPVQFNRVLTNVGNGYDQKTGIFTAPFSGLYTFHLHFIGGLHNGSTDLGLYAGGQVIAVAFAEGENKDDNDQGSCTAVVDLLRGDEVSVKFYYGNPQIWGSRLTSFSGCLFTLIDFRYCLYMTRPIVVRKGIHVKA